MAIFLMLLLVHWNMIFRSIIYVLYILLLPLHILHSLTSLILLHPFPFPHSLFFSSFTHFKKYLPLSHSLIDPCRASSREICQESRSRSRKSAGNDVRNRWGQNVEERERGVRELSYTGQAPLFCLLVTIFLH